MEGLSRRRGGLNPGVLSCKAVDTPEVAAGPNNPPLASTAHWRSASRRAAVSGFCRIRRESACSGRHTMRALLMLVVGSLLAASNAALDATFCDHVFSSSSGKLSLSGGNCTALILPSWFYPPPAPIGALAAPGGVAVAKVSFLPRMGEFAPSSPSPGYHQCSASSMFKAQEPSERAGLPMM